MYCIEITLKFSPFPLVVQRKELNKAENLYSQIRESINKSQPKLLELTCEKVENKKIAVLVDEIIAVQVYEKTASGGGSKRPGFSFET